VVTPLVNFIGVKPTIMSATVAGLFSRLRPTPNYTTLRDVTVSGLDAFGILYIRHAWKR